MLIIVHYTRFAQLRQNDVHKGGPNTIIAFHLLIYGSTIALLMYLVFRVNMKTAS